MTKRIRVEMEVADRYVNYWQRESEKAPTPTDDPICQNIVSVEVVEPQRRTRLTLEGRFDPLDWPEGTDLVVATHDEHDEHRYRAFRVVSCEQIESYE